MQDNDVQHKTFTLIYGHKSLLALCEIIPCDLLRDMRSSTPSILQKVSAMIPIVTGLRTVGMAGARVVVLGSADRLTTGDLTICTGLIGKLLVGGVHKGTLMVHQGNNHPRELRENIFAALKANGLSCDNIRLQNIVVQTAPDVQHDTGNTTDDLLFALDGMVDPEEVLRVSEPAPGKNFLANEMTANIKQDGTYDVPKRKGMFEICSVQ
jgi:hypothetical protein